MFLINFFINIVTNLKISIENDFDTCFIPMEDLVQNAIRKYRNHPSVVIIKKKQFEREILFFSGTVG